MTTAKAFSTTHSGRTVRIIEADPECVSVQKISGNVRSSGLYGVNGTFFVSSDNFLGIAVRNGSGIAGNATYNGHNNMKRGTFHSFQNLRGGYREHGVSNVTNYNQLIPGYPNSNHYAIGGLNLYPSDNITKQEFYRRLDVDENSSGVNNVVKKDSSGNYIDPTLRGRTAIGYSSNGKIILAVFQDEHPWGMRDFMKQQGCFYAVYLDGGGSSQMRYKSGGTSYTFEPENDLRPVYSMVTVNPTSWT